MGRKERVEEGRRRVDAEAVIFTCPACDRPQTTIKKKRYRCCFCETETSRVVAKAAGCLAGTSTVKEKYDKWSRKTHTKILDQLNRHRGPTKSGKRRSHK
jgi:hypothetical protein